MGGGGIEIFINLHKLNTSHIDNLFVNCLQPGDIFKKIKTSRIIIHLNPVPQINVISTDSVSIEPMEFQSDTVPRSPFQKAV